MNYQNSFQNVPSTSNSTNHNNNNFRRIVSPHLQRHQNKWEQDNKRYIQESIYRNTLQYNPFGFVQNVHFTQIPQQFQFPNHFIPSKNYYTQYNLNKTWVRSSNHENPKRKTHIIDAKTFTGVRLWEKVSSNKEEPSGLIFSVMSYNVLAQDLINQHLGLYSQHCKQTLHWEVRWLNLVSEIKQYNPDILCLQEVQASHLDSHYSILETLGYRGLYKQRTGIRTDGCAIYYKIDLFNLIEHTTVEYRQPQIQILNRDNVAIIAKFSPKSNPMHQFVVSTTHLLYNPKRQDVRLAQTQLLLTEVDRIAFNKINNEEIQYIPVILTGDLNATPDSPIYNFITQGRFKYENLSPRSLQKANKRSLTNGKTFLPEDLRITDQCQHADLISKRRNNILLSRSEELKIIELKHSERSMESDDINENRKINDQHLFSGGTLTHQLFLNSVYCYKINGDIEATTHQDEWIPVDYIFYSKRSTEKGHLILLERLKLPTRAQLGDVKIPNKNFGSDHFSLIAKFALV